MRHYKAKALNNIVKATVMMLLVSFCLPLIGYSQKDTIERLIQQLKDKDWEVRKGVARSLGWTKDARAVEALIASLRDEHFSVRRKAAEALGKIKDTRAVEALIAALRDGNLEIVAGAYRFFILRGVLGREDVLIEALNIYGTAEMAKDFLNCGNSKLAEAARDWAKRHDYIIIYQ